MFPLLHHHLTMQENMSGNFLTTPTKAHSEPINQTPSYKPIPLKRFAFPPHSNTTHLPLPLAFKTPKSPSKTSFSHTKYYS